MKARRAKSGSTARAVGAAASRARLQRTEKRLREVEERHVLAMAAIRESVYDYDVLRDSIYYSESMQRELGLPPGTLRTPQDWRDRIHPDDWLRYHEAFVAHLKGATGRFVCDYRYRGGDGTWRWARQHGLAVRDKNGRALRVVGSTGDITDLKRAEESLEQMRGRYDLALRAIHEGVYEWDIAGGTAYYSERLYEVLKLASGDLKGPMDWRKRIHPEDLPQYDAGLVAHFKGQTERFECEYRYKARDGSWRWARQHGLALRDASGRALRMTGSTGDITDLKQTQEALRTSEERYARAMQAAVEGIYEWDIVSGKLFLTQRAKEFFSLSAEDLTPAAWNVRVHAEDYPRYTAAIVEHFRGRTPHLEIEYRIADASGGYRWVLDRGKAVRNAEGRAIKMVGALSDITARKRAEMDLRRAGDEATEALEQQTATANVLRVISGSLTDLAPVFDTILDNAVRLCEGNTAVLWRFDGEVLRFAAHKNGSAKGVAYLQQRPLALGDYNPTPQAGLERRTIHVVDVFAEARYRPLVPPDTHRTLPNSGTVLAVPLLKDDRLLGVITIWRFEKRMFTDKQVAMVNTFAAQAVIAIENVRLFNETKEALEQQTATAEILKVMSGSLTDIQPVVDVVAATAARLCEANDVLIQLRDGDLMRSAAHHGSIPVAPTRPVSRRLLLGRVVEEGRQIQVDDIQKEDKQYPESAESARRQGFHTILHTPLMRAGKVIGIITMRRTEVKPFNQKQKALVKTFADQAVIAIENVRLFNETKEALERQTATSEVLKVISQTKINLEPVLDIVLKNARRLCGADQAVIFRADGEGNCVPASLQVSERANEIMEFYRAHPIPPNRGSATGRAVLEGRAIHIPDVLADPEYRMEYAANRNYRSILAVPMLREGSAIGVLTVTRVGEPRPFTDKQIELVTSFADQAVIAIENVRLFNETTEALEQQKASAEILRVISSSVADTAPVFEAILESCVRLFEGKHVAISLVGDDGKIHLAAYHGPRRAELEAHYPVPLSMDSGAGAAILQRAVMHYPNIAEGGDVPVYVRTAGDLMGYKAVILAPMLWEDKAIGAIWVSRDFAGSYTDKEIALLKTFADQAVIAIQNARLFREIHEKSKQLEIANQHKSEFLANMSHELRTPLNAIIGFTRIVMRRSKEQLEPKQYENLEKIHSSGQHLLQLINAILDLSKVEAGRVEVNAADVALGSVLEQCVKTVEPLVKAPAVRLLREYDGELPRVYQDEEKLRQIVINLLSNAAKFTERGMVRVQAKRNGDSFSVAVADTGIGIAPDKLEHVFEEFAQADASSTRVYGGTGLGLTIARRLARLMGGDISAHSDPGVGSTFTLTLPLRYEPLAEVQAEPKVQARA